LQSRGTHPEAERRPDAVFAREKHGGKHDEAVPDKRNRASEDNEYENEKEQDHSFTGHQ
jgi:hypothetical protein